MNDNFDVELDEVDDHQKEKVGFKRGVKGSGGFKNLRKLKKSMRKPKKSVRKSRKPKKSVRKSRKPVKKSPCLKKKKSSCVKSRKCYWSKRSRSKSPCRLNGKRR